MSNVSSRSSRSKQKSRRRYLTALTVALGAMSGSARAAEWRYCYAVERQSQRFIISLPFAADDPPSSSEAAFAKHLRSLGMEIASVCTRSVTDVIALNRIKAAEGYNRQEGRTIVRLNWPTQANSY